MDGQYFVKMYLYGNKGDAHGCGFPNDQADDSEADRRLHALFLKICKCGMTLLFKFIFRLFHLRGLDNAYPAGFDARFS